MYLCIFIYLFLIFTLQLTDVHSEAAVQRCNIKIVVMEILENFQENIGGRVQYWLNFGMKAWSFTYLVLQHGCALNNFSRFSEQLLRRIPHTNHFCILWSIWKSTWHHLIHSKTFFYFFSRGFSLAKDFLGNIFQPYFAGILHF